MTNEEQKFEQYVNSLRFDDEPSQDHRDKLEKKLLEAYDYQQKYGGYVEPVSIYLRKIAIAAGFLIVCGALFWTIDTYYIGSSPPYANDPEIKELLEQKDISGHEEKQLLARLNEIWEMIRSKDADALVSVLQSDEITGKVRLWAAKYLGQFGNQQTLTMLEQTIEQMHITDPNHPLMIAAQKIRCRLGPLPPPSDSDEDK